MQFPDAVAALAKGGSRLWLDPNGVSWGIFRKIVDAQPEGGAAKHRKTSSNSTPEVGESVLERQSPIQVAKAIKVRGAACVLHALCGVVA
jgi:hypothetical protein